MSTAGFDRARELVAAYGAARSRWPEAERELHDLLSQNIEGQDLLARATRLDTELDGLMSRPADPLRPARILKAARAMARRRRMVRWVSLAYAASMMLGLSLGYGLSAEHAAEESYGGLLVGSIAIEDFL